MIDSFSIVASSDINGTVIWIVIVVGIAIVNYLREMFKKTGPDKEDRDDGSSQARKVRQIIEEMKRGGQASSPRQPRPSYQEPVMPASTPSQAVRHVASKPRPSAAVPSGWEDTPAELAAKTAALQRVPDMTKSVERSMSNLSDAERKALEQLKSGKVSTVAKRSSASPRPASGSLAAGLRSREALRMAVIYREILGEPTALKSR